MSRLAASYFAIFETWFGSRGMAWVAVVVQPALIMFLFGFGGWQVASGDAPLGLLAIGAAVLGTGIMVTMAVRGDRPRPGPPADWERD